MSTAIRSGRSTEHRAIVTTTGVIIVWFIYVSLDGAVSYSMPQGERRKDVDLYDAIYDGDVTPVNVSGLTTAILTGKEFIPSWLSNGLGHLTDGVEGQSNFRLDPRGFGVKGYDWIGWRNETFASSATGNLPSIEMTWKFDSVRNFTSVKLHCNNMFTKEVRVFRESLVSFSINGVMPSFSSPPIEYRYVRDSTSEAARWVIIPLHQRIGRFVKIRLYFDTRWMLISEVQFLSEYATEDLSTETNQNEFEEELTANSSQNDAEAIHQVAPNTVIERKLKTSTNFANVTSRTPTHDKIELQSDGKLIQNGDDFVRLNSTTRFYDEAIGVAVGTLSTILMFLVVFVIMCCIRKRCRRKYEDSTFNSCRGNGTVKCSADLPSSGAVAISNGVVQSTVTNGNAACLTSGPCDFIVPAGGNTSQNNDLCRRPAVDSDVVNSVACTSPCFRLLSIFGKTNTRDTKAQTNNAQSNIEFYRVPSDRERGLLNRLGQLPRTPHSSDAYNTAHHEYDDIKPEQLFASTDARMTSRSQQTIPAADADWRVPPSCHVTSVAAPVTQECSVFRLPSVGRTKSIFPVNQNHNNSSSCGPPPSYSWENLTSSAFDAYNTYCQRQNSLLALEETEPWMKRESGEFQRTSSSLLGTAELMTSYGLPEFVCKGFRFVEKIGDGLFGEVHLCEADNLADHITDHISVINVCDSNSQVTLRSMRSRRLIVVLVKTVKRSLDYRARREFERELHVMSSVRHSNVIRLLGVHFHNNQVPYLVMEYPRHGDLVQFLRHHSQVDDITTESTSTLGASCRQRQQFSTLRYSLLVNIATQIADGMKHLESLNIVHRDLAARNCLIGDDCQVKVADLGPGRDLYSSDYWYHQKDDSLLPIRWMSWEAVLEGQLSARSDVWSFGMTLWEVLTFCRTQPLYTLTDQQVLDNLDCMRSSFVTSGRHQVSISNSVSGLSVVPLTLPHRPNGCPLKIYDMMLQCWHSDCDQRPSFHQIYQFLQQINDLYIQQQTWTQRAQ